MTPTTTDGVPASRPSGSVPTEIRLWRCAPSVYLFGLMITIPGMYLLAYTLSSGAWVLVPPAIGWVVLGMFILLGRSGVRLDPVTQQAMVWRGMLFPIMRRVESIDGAHGVSVRTVTCGRISRHEVHVERSPSSSHLESFSCPHEAAAFAGEVRRFLGM